MGAFPIARSRNREILASGPIRPSQNLTISATHAVALFVVLALFSPIASAQPAPQAVRFTVFSAQPLTGLAYAPRAGAGHTAGSRVLS